MSPNDFALTDMDFLVIMKLLIDSKNMFKKIFTSFLLAVILLSVGAFLVYSSKIDSVANDRIEKRPFEIARGATVEGIAKDLQAQKLITSSFYFKLYVWREKLGAKFQAGIYEVSPDQTLREIATVLTSGKAVSQEREIKLLEGWSAKEIAAYLAKEKLIDETEFSSLVGVGSTGVDNKLISAYPILADLPRNASLEGYLFPDTYRIFKNASERDIVEKMLTNLELKINGTMRSDIKKQGKTVFEILTMASIIQKEVRGTKDMRQVADIFWKRIDSGIALESCATLAYILGVNKPQYTLEDTQIDSPYNSYRNRGLPPGPIDNPGLEAIRAAIYPEKNDYLFFLSRPDTGETVFSRNYAEHLQNKAKYLD